MSSAAASKFLAAAGRATAATLRAKLCRTRWGRTWPTILRRARERIVYCAGAGKRRDAVKQLRGTSRVLNDVDNRVCCCCVSRESGGTRARTVEKSRRRLMGREKVVAGNTINCPRRRRRLSRRWRTGRKLSNLNICTREHTHTNDG